MCASPASLQRIHRRPARRAHPDAPRQGAARGQGPGRPGRRCRCGRGRRRRADRPTGGRRPVVRAGRLVPGPRPVGRRPQLHLARVVLQRRRRLPRRGLVGPADGLWRVTPAPGDSCGQPPPPGSHAALLAHQRAELPDGFRGRAPSVDLARTHRCAGESCHGRTPSRWRGTPRPRPCPERRRTRAARSCSPCCVLPAVCKSSPASPRTQIGALSRPTTTSAARVPSRRVSRAPPTSPTTTSTAASSAPAAAAHPRPHTPPPASLALLDPSPAATRSRGPPAAESRIFLMCRLVRAVSACLLPAGSATPSSTAADARPTLLPPAPRPQVVYKGQPERVWPDAFREPETLTLFLVPARRPRPHPALACELALLGCSSPPSLPR